jgi:hypothetical protein
MKKTTRTKKASPQKPPFDWIKWPGIEETGTLYRNGSDEIRDLIDAGYRIYKTELFNSETLELPDTFEELLDKEEARPGSVHVSTFAGILRTANYFWEDTETAKEIIKQIDKDDFPKVRTKPPRRIYEADMEETPDDVLDLVLEDKKDGEDEASFQKRLSRIWVAAEFFTNPDGRLAEMIKKAKTDKERVKLAAIFRPIVEDDYRKAAEAVAKKIGVDPADVRNPKKRTEEQYSLLLEAVRKTVTKRIDTVYDSNFVGALFEILYKPGVTSKLSSAIVRGVARYSDGRKPERGGEDLRQDPSICGK